MRVRLLTLAVGLLSFGIGPAVAEVYKTPAAFVAEAGGDFAAPALLLPSRELQQRIAAVLGHPYRSLRIRYWLAGSASLWVLDEVGKDELITIGFQVRDAMIEATEVLEFRESRGWEIRFPAFTRQFRGARLADDGERLDRRIDGITGATLSVGAYQRLARLALLLHRQLVQDGKLGGPGR